MLHPKGCVMENNHVVVVLTDNSGRKLFDKVIYYQKDEIDKVQRHINLLRVVGYKASAIEMPLEEFNSALTCDVFFAYALAYRIAYDLACLGRECMRKANEQNWRSDLKKLCGSENSVRAMIGFALKDPEEAHKLWTLLISSNGERNFMGHRINAADLKKKKNDHNNSR